MKMYWLLLQSQKSGRHPEIKGTAIDYVLIYSKEMKKLNQRVGKSPLLQDESA